MAAILWALIGTHCRAGPQGRVPPIHRLEFGQPGISK